jgi:signal transduction histidine kinase
MKNPKQSQNAINTPNSNQKVLEAGNMKWRQMIQIIWIILAVFALGILVTSLPGYALRIKSGLPGHGPGETPSTKYTIFQIINVVASLGSAILSLYLAWVLFRRLFDNLAVTLISFFLLIYSVIMTGPLETWGYYWFGNYGFAVTVQGLLVATPLVALLFLFPNGKFVPTWTRWALLISIPWNIIVFLMPGTFHGNGDFSGLMVLFFLWIIFPFFGIYAQIYRYRNVSSPDERQQTKWVLFGFLLWITYMLISSIPYFYLTNLPANAPMPWWAPVSELGWWLSVNIIPVTLGIAIMRSRLWNISLVINRTLVYAALTLITVTLYILVVGTLGSLLQVGDRSLIAFLTTGLVAVLFQPLRTRLQAWVNRLMYGDRDDPVAVLTQLVENLENSGSPEEALSEITETVARTLKISYVAIALGKKAEIMAAYGLPKSDTTRLPLVYQNEIIGHLIVSPRAPGEPFNQSDLDLLNNIAQHAGAAAHTVTLTANLRSSRLQLITTREEERRRLRRDLHDGLGPTLASLTLKLDAARNLLKNDPEAAEEILGELKQQTQETIQDIRTLVYDLRPPALDDMGLVGAIQNFIDRYTEAKASISLEIDAGFPPLPAAFEVAIYRIALEGITNIQRHAKANNGRVQITHKSSELIIEIWDDGKGLSGDHVKGVGLASMQERAEELGGRFEIIPSQQGSHLRARLPLLKE